MLVEHRRVAVRGLHGLGKTAIAAAVALWGVSVFDEDVKVPMTASVWRQLKFFLLPELHKWARHADWERIGESVTYGKELLEQQLRLPRGREAFALASNDPAFIEGAHASHLIYIFDEAKAIPDPVWDAAEGAFSAGDCYFLAISTPGEPSGRFYDIHKRKPGYSDWKVRHVTQEEAIAAGRVSREWIEARKAQWGEQSAIYQNRALGEFAESGDGSVIPLAWITAAHERWRQWNGKPLPNALVSYGVDPAYMGEDKTAVATLAGRIVLPLVSYAKQDTMQTAGRVAVTVGRESPVAVDTIGVGAGVHDRLRELGFNVIGVNVSTKTDMTDKSGLVGFVNLRAALWWMLREALDPDGEGPIALPPDDDELVGDLTVPGYWYTSAGNIQVESKDDMRARLGRSPDRADAVALALYASRQTKLLMA